MFHNIYGYLILHNTRAVTVSTVCNIYELRYVQFRHMNHITNCIHPHCHLSHLLIHFTSYVTAQLALLNKSITQHF